MVSGHRVVAENRWVTAAGTRAAILYLLITCALVSTVLQSSAGFSYSLDDPYIHLALAQHIAHGTYGVNAGEITSPASSVIWPFLLVPFANSAMRGWSPLLLNLFAGLAACLLFGRFVLNYWRERWSQTPEAVKWLLMLLFVIAGNLPALTLMGMEHTLQVLLAAACAFGIAEAYFGRPVPKWALICAALAPSVRYEDLAFTLAVCLALWFQRRKSAAIVTGLISLVPLVALGLFLHAHGLSFLPNSVIVKGGVISARPHLLPRFPLLDHFLTIIAVNVEGYATLPERWPITLFLIALSVQLWRARRNPVKRKAMASAVLGLALIMAVGPYGYFFRYDVAYRLFAFLLVFAAASEYRWFGALQAKMLGAVAAAVYCVATLLTPDTCWAVSHEQKQMQRFSHDLYRKNIAVNDLGWVSYDSGDRFYILDLAGLASNEASHQRNKDAAWLHGIVQRHNVGLAMIYSYWFTSIPADWKVMAVLQRYGEGRNKVTFYATQLGDQDQIRADLKAFAATLPDGTWLTDENGQRTDPPKP